MSLLMMAPEPLEFMPRGGASYLKHTVFDHSPAHRNRLACVVRMLQGSSSDPKSTRVLEIGCGLGFVAIPIASLGYPITAIDVHGPSVAAAQRRNTFRNLNLTVQPAEHADVAAYDAIILTEVVEFLRDYRALIRLLGKGMKPGARLILTLSNGRSLAERLSRPSYALRQSAMGARIVAAVKWILHTRDLASTHAVSRHVNFPSLRDLDKLFGEAGLKPILFHRYFDRWVFRETFFSERGTNEKRAQADFQRSQKLPPERCSLWAFLLEKA